jgi:MFS family permease
MIRRPPRSTPRNTLFPYTTEIPNTGTVIFVGVLAFVLTGIIVGFASPGNTIAEAGVAGLVLSIFSVAIAAGAVEEVELMWLPVGELLQGTLSDREDRKGHLQWMWVGAGVVIGVLLNSYAVVLGRALFGLGPGGILIAYSLSFLITGFLIGAFSPGITLAEPALAAVGVIIVDALVTAGGLGAPFPMLAIIIASVCAFCLALVGGWVGELAQVSWQRTHPAT